MADIADNAGELIELLAVEDLRRAVGKSAPESHPNFDGSSCIDCTEEIHPARLKLGKIRCVECQGRLERRQARRV